MHSGVRWLNAKQGKSAMILEKQLLLPINLGKVISPFPNHLKSIIPQYGRLFKWKTFKIVSNHPKSGCLSKCILWSDRVLLRDAVKNYPRATSQTLLAFKTLILITVQQKKDWTSMIYIKGLPGEPLFSLNRTWQHALGLKSCIWSNFWNN